jgi:tetratricopeptide (TPR) repeat protein
MSINVAKSRFIVPSLVAKYRLILDGISNIVELGKHLTSAAETAQLMRQTDTVREYGLILSNLPVKEYQLIGQYYLGWYAWCNGDDVTTSLFENIFDRSETYKAKSLITLGALTGARGNLEEEMRYHKEALKYSNLATSITIHRAIAIVKSKEGFHKSAIRTLESLLPALRFTQSQVYYNTLNSLAVELAEVGRIEEARNISNIVLASPYVFAYPEWRETRDDIERKGYRSSRSFTALLERLVPQNIVRLPERESTPTSQDKPGKVLYPDWENMVKKDKNGDKNPELPKDMNVADMMIMIMNLMSKEGNATEEKMRKLLDYAIKLFSK